MTVVRIDDGLLELRPFINEGPTEGFRLSVAGVDRIQGGDPVALGEAIERAFAQAVPW